MLSRLYAGLSQERLDRILTQGLSMAGTSLSKIVSGKVEVSINEFRLVPLWEVTRTLWEPDHRVVGVSFKLTGELQGHLSLLLEPEGVLSLMDVLLKRPAGTTLRFEDLERSVIKEVANILANSYLTVLGHEINRAVMPSAPRFLEAPLGDVLESLLLDHSEIAVEDRFLLLRNTLTTSSLKLDGNLLVFLNRSASVKSEV